MEVGRRFFGAEAPSKEGVDLKKMSILAVVGSEQSENLCHRKGKGSLAMFVSQGLVDPNLLLKRRKGKGKRLIIRYSLGMCGDASSISDVSG